MFAFSSISHQGSWWCHQMKKFSASLALCLGISLVTGEFPSQRPVTWSFDVFFDLCLNKWLSKQSRRRWFEMPPRSLWHHCNGVKLLKSFLVEDKNLLIVYGQYYGCCWPGDIRSQGISSLGIKLVHPQYQQNCNIRHTKSPNLHFLVSSCSGLCLIHWSQVLSQEWRCSWRSADRWCSNYIWVINNVIAY